MPSMEVDREGQDGQMALLLAVVGHDLRSPLAAISLVAETLSERPSLAEEDVRLVKRIHQSAKRMAEMVERLLDLARINQAGRCIPRVELVDIFDVCRDVLEELQLINPGRRFELQRRGETLGRWDRTLICEMLANLLSNAVQYGQADRPVCVGLAEDDDDQVCLTVHNDGEPIAVDELPHVFEPFRGARRYHQGSSSNLGLGLHIVREIVGAHRGAVAVSSTAAMGTTFTIRLPRV